MIRPIADRGLFYIAAGFNWSVAAVFLFAGDAAMDRLGIYPPRDLILYRLLLLMVALFGAGYFIVGRDPTRNHGIVGLGIVGLGIVGKLTIFATFLAHAIQGEVPYSAVAVTFIDVIFAALFAEFLWRAGRSAPSVACEPGRRVTQ